MGGISEMMCIKGFAQLPAEDKLSEKPLPYLAAPADRGPPQVDVRKTQRYLITARSL